MNQTMGLSMSKYAGVLTYAETSSVLSFPTTKRHREKLNLLTGNGQLMPKLSEIFMLRKRQQARP